MGWFILPMPICGFSLAVRHTLVQLTVPVFAKYRMFSSIYLVPKLTGSTFHFNGTLKIGNILKAKWCQIQNLLLKNKITFTQIKKWWLQNFTILKCVLFNLHKNVFMNFMKWLISVCLYFTLWNTNLCVRLLAKQCIMHVYIYQSSCVD